MTVPGPSLPVWGVELIVLAIVIAILGEALRGLVARRVPLFRAEDPIERGLLDLYLGGGALYLIAALPAPVFYPITIAAALLLGIGALVWRNAPRARREKFGTRAARWATALRRPEYLLALAATLGLFAIELSAIHDVGSGNTYDASLLSTYTGLLLAHHTIPLSLAPVASEALAYPQGTTVWLATAQLTFGLAPLETSLLVTPLFLSIAPLGAFVFGNRIGGSASTGAAFALVFALLAAGSRGLVAGSNDFVFALPLVLLLAGWSLHWVRPGELSASDAVAFGGLTGYAAALNPVGPTWLLLTLPVFGLLARPRFGGAVGRWALRWASAVAASLVAVAPSLYAILRSPAAVGLTDRGGGSLGTPSGESFSQFVGYVDPFLFRSQDQLLSPFPLLRGELAVLLIGGALLLVLGRKRFRLPEELARLTLAMSVVAILLLAAGALAFVGVFPFSFAFRFTSVAELSMTLFVVYTIIAAVPLAAATGEVVDRRAGGWLAETRVRGNRARGPRRNALAALVAVAILLPGLAITTVEMPEQLHAEYTTFSNLTQADSDLLGWAPNHLPASSRVVVAPGSAAEFLAAYDPSLVLLYPMTVGFLTAHPTYWVVVNQLTNGTMNATGWSALRGLGADYLAITENNTALFRPMAPGPLLTASLPVVFHEGGVYLFDVRSA